MGVFMFAPRPFPVARFDHCHASRRFARFITGNHETPKGVESNCQNAARDLEISSNLLLFL
jgi:hypothetical protein